MCCFPQDMEELNDLVHHFADVVKVSVLFVMLSASDWH